MAGTKEDETEGVEYCRRILEPRRMIRDVSSAI